MNKSSSRIGLIPRGFAVPPTRKMIFALAVGAVAAPAIGVQTENVLAGRHSTEFTGRHRQRDAQPNRSIQTNRLSPKSKPYRNKFSLASLKTLKNICSI
jgi:hypothetical protein